MTRYWTYSLSLMGTQIDITVDHPRGPELLTTAVQRLQEWEHRFSANDPDSELMQVNQAAGQHPVVVHPELFYLIQQGRDASLASDRRLNIAIGPLVKLWRIGFQDATVPTAGQIEARLNLINSVDIQLDPDQQTVFLPLPGMELDLGALAKGYIADQLIDIFQAAGAFAGSVNLGGNLKFYGARPHHPQDPCWRIGIQDPTQVRGQYRAILQLEGQSVVTSGDYVRQFQHQGQVFHHLLDSRTGAPYTQQIRSITVVSASSLDGEIWTSSLFPLNPAEILDRVESTAGIEAVVIDQANQVTYSTGLSSRIIIK